MDITELYQASKQYRKFLLEYLDQIANLEECVMVLTGDFGARSTTQCRARIINIDLWIDVHIETYPQLQPFRDHVLGKIKELGLTPYPKFIYECEKYYRK